MYVRRIKRLILLIILLLCSSYGFKKPEPLEIEPVVEFRRVPKARRTNRAHKYMNYGWMVYLLVRQCVYYDRYLACGYLRKHNKIYYGRIRIAGRLNIF